MAASITTATPLSFKVEILTATHDFTASTGDTFKLALIKAGHAGTYGAASTNYSDITGNGDEASGTGYTTGGATLTSVTPVLDGTVAVCDFADVTWSGASFSARGAMVYNSSKGNKACAVLDFGENITVSSGNFVVTFPSPTNNTAVVKVF